MPPALPPRPADYEHERAWPVLAVAAAAIVLSFALLPVAPGWNLIPDAVGIAWSGRFWLRSRRRYKRWQQANDDWCKQAFAYIRTQRRICEQWRQN